MFAEELAAIPTVYRERACWLVCAAGMPFPGIIDPNTLEPKAGINHENRYVRCPCRE